MEMGAGYPKAALAGDRLVPASPAPPLVLTSHWLRSPRSCRRDQMLWILPACSGWLLLSPQEHWCLSITES